MVRRSFAAPTRTLVEANFARAVGHIQRRPSTSILWTPSCTSTGAMPTARRGELRRPRSRTSRGPSSFARINAAAYHNRAHGQRRCRRTSIRPSVITREPPNSRRMIPIRSTAGPRVHSRQKGTTRRRSRDYAAAHQARTLPCFRGYFQFAANALSSQGKPRRGPILRPTPRRSSFSPRHARAYVLSRACRSKLSNASTRPLGRPDDGLAASDGFTPEAFLASRPHPRRAGPNTRRP